MFYNFIVWFTLTMCFFFCICRQGVHFRRRVKKKLRSVAMYYNARYARDSVLYKVTCLTKTSIQKLHWQNSLVIGIWESFQCAAKCSESLNNWCQKPRVEYGRGSGLFSEFDLHLSWIKNKFPSMSPSEQNAFGVFSKLFRLATAVKLILNKR